jgi:hypothetical protein
MPYVLQELLENDEPTTLGEPVHDFIVAKVIASRRAVRTQRVTLITDNATGKEVARFDPTVPAPKTSVTRMRADAAVPLKTDSESGISIKKSG